MKPQRYLLALLLLAVGAFSPLHAQSPSPELSPELRALWEQHFPGLEVTPERLQMMTQIGLNRELSVPERLRAISRLSGIDQLPEGQRVSRTICVWDIIGRNGPVYNAAMEQRALALEYGIELKIVPFTNEGVMVEELKAARCDAALMSGLRAREFNLYSGTIDAIGATPDIDHLKMVLQAATHPRNAGKMAQGAYVVMGIFPAGAAYVFVNDRNINTLAKAAGKRVAVLENDPMQARMIAAVGATPVATDLTRAPGMFNNKAIDVLAAPMVAYEPLELYKGMSPNGGVIQFPLVQLTMQLIGRLDKFPNEVAQLIREGAFEQFDTVIQTVQQVGGTIPDKWWIPIPEKDMQEYELMMQDARIALRDFNYYDADMLTLQRRVRCRFDAARSECAQPRE